VQLTRGDIVLVHTPRSFICWLIRKVTDSHWNHVAWYIGDDRLVEAQGGEGVHYSPVSRYDLDDDLSTQAVRILPGIIHPVSMDAAIRIACQADGKRYDWKLILSLMWLYLTGSRKRKEARDWNCGWICSELIAMPLWKVCRFKFRNSVPPENTVPADIAESGKVAYL